MPTSRLTTDYKTIENWVKARDGKPAEVDGNGKGEAGLLRIEPPPKGDDADTDGLKRLSWPSFWKRFDEQELAFLHQDETGRGGRARYLSPTPPFAEWRGRPHAPAKYRSAPRRPGACRPAPRRPGEGRTRRDQPVLQVGIRAAGAAIVLGQTKAISYSCIDEPDIEGVSRMNTIK